MLENDWKSDLRSVLIFNILIPQCKGYMIDGYVLNATFNNISVISWQSILLMKDTRVHHQPVASHWHTYHIMLYRVHLIWACFELTTLVLINTDCKGSCKSNYNTITASTAHQRLHENNCILYNIGMCYMILSTLTFRFFRHNRFNCVIVSLLG